MIRARSASRIAATVTCTCATAILAATACAVGRPLPSLGTRESSAPVGAVWPSTLVAAHDALAAGRHATADTLLRSFADAYAGTSEATEADYWRAVVALDPGNAQGSARDAATLLAGYLEARRPLTHRTEAAVLHRLATSLADASRSGTAARAGAGADARDAELQRLRRELDETKAELERIRKRLAPPAAGTPPPATPPPTAPPPG